jgi:hypothetical protein
MAMNKKTKKSIIVIAASLFAVFVLPRLISDYRLRGPWNGETSLAEVKKSYPGIRVSLFGSKVTVPGRADMVGTLSGNVLSWSNGSTWKR